MVTSKDGEVLNLVVTTATRICAVVAYQGSIAEEEEVRIGIEERIACIASEAIYVPTVASYSPSISLRSHRSVIG